MTPDFYTEHPEIRPFVEEVPAELADKPEYFHIAESARRLGTKKIELFSDRCVPLPDGSRVLVLDGLPGIGPDTFTVREYSCSDQRSGCVEILAAKRNEASSASVHCSLSVYEGGITEFDFCCFNRTFDFAPGAQVLHELRIEQFYYPLIEGDPAAEDLAKRVAESDWNAGIFQDSGRITT
jgi:hypothetical protein